RRRRDRERVGVTERAGRLAGAEQRAGALVGATGRQPPREVRGGAELVDGILERMQRHRALAGQHRLIDRARRVYRLREMMGEELGLLYRHVGQPGLDRLRHAAVQLLTLRARDRVVHELPKERLPDPVVAVRRELDETSSREAGERCFDVEPVTEYRAQEGRVTCAPGDREHVKDAA